MKKIISGVYRIRRAKPLSSRVFAAATVFVTFGCYAATTTAGEAPDSDTSLETIVVTAERRAESIQDTPLSVTAITGVTLEKFDVKDFGDYASMVPNLSYGTGNNLGVATARAVTIRGVAGTNPVTDANTTNFYVNDTPVPLSLDPRILDVQRIEVLRGPQGTLFGSASMGGTVRVITRSADTMESGGFVDIQGFDINHGGAGYDASGTYNLPLIQDELALKVSAYNSYKPGIFTREYGIATTSGFLLPATQGAGVVSHVGDDQEFGGAVTLTFTPEGLKGLTVTPMVIYQSARSNGLPLADFSPNDLIQDRPLNVEESTRDDWSFASLTAKYTSSIGSFISSSTQFHRQAFDDEDGTEVITSVFGVFAAPPLPNTYSAAPSPTNNNTSAFTQELRFESTFSAPIQIVAGAYYNNTKIVSIQQILTPTDGAGAPAYTADTPRNNRETAEFADVSYDVTSAFQVSAGIREAALKDDFSYTANGWLNGGLSSTTLTHGEHALTPRFTAKYRFDEGAMVYANAAKGYRVGGQNVVPPSLCDADLVAAGFAPGKVPSYSSDSLWSYELGTKNSWAGNRINTRFALFYIDWDKIQQSVLLPCTFPIIENAGTAVSKGAELEADMSPFRGLKFNLALGYDDAKITASPPGGAFVVGQRLNGVPKLTASLLGDYSVPTPAGAAFVRAQYSYTGQSISYINDPLGRVRNAYTLVNVYSGLSRGSWETSLFVKNLFDVRANLGDEQAEVAELPNRPRWLISQPRTIGIELKYGFRDH